MAFIAAGIVQYEMKKISTTRSRAQIQGMCPYPLQAEPQEARMS